MNYLPIIGLEVHVELKTRSKMFCGCSADYFGQKPNTHTCPVCLGLPGALPVPNKQAIHWCIMMGLAVSCEIPLASKFDRKNYFYPDLPKGYQISQYDKPMAVDGKLKVQSQKYEVRSDEVKIRSAKSEVGSEKVIRIRRVHMEEDTGKLIHTGNDTFIDFNRSGVPLVEIVTEPDIHSAAEAKEYLQKLQRIIRHLGVSDADMEKGSMRMEPNISLKVRSQKLEVRSGKCEVGSGELPNYKVEVKNINSFRFVEKAINFEITRQQELLERGEKIVQETRGWNEGKQATVSQRSKEEAHDYRYFPEPDIPPMVWKKEDIKLLTDNMPEQYEVKYARFIQIYGLPVQYVEMALSHPNVTNYVETAIKLGSEKKPPIPPKAIADYLFNKKVDMAKVMPAQLIQLIASASSKPIMATAQLNAIVAKVVADNPNIVADFKAGKETVINVLIGKAMKEARGMADANNVRAALIKAIQ